MHFEQFYLACLSHASYLLGSEGVAAIVDPQRDVGIYLEAAAQNNLRIQYIIETHLHADFVSGHRELAARTGADIYLGARAGAKFPHVGVCDGDELAFGQCRLRFLETPGHTMESMSVVVTDLEKSDQPYAVLTGDTLFIGDVGRPDLSPDNTPQQLAALLYESLHAKLLTLPDSVQVFPAHGAGSLCGRQMGSERSSTIGKEKISNYALRAGSRDEFVHLLTAELRERPGYFALDVEMNRSGAPALTELAPIPALEPAEFQQRQKEGRLVLDTRAATEFASGHIPGSIHIALSGQFASWAGILIGVQNDLLLVAEDPERVNEARLRLARVGIEHVSGSLAGGLPAWVVAGFPVEEFPRITVQQLQQSLDAEPDHVQIVDVRRAEEWQTGHLAQARLKPLDKLTNLLDDLDPARPVAVHCKGGYRSAIAASLLQAAGCRQVMDVIGGIDSWVAGGLPVA